MGQGSFTLSWEVATKASGVQDESMGMVSKPSLIMVFMRACGRMTKSMARVATVTRMERSMKVNGPMTNDMVKASSSIWTAAFTTGNGGWVTDMATEFFSPHWAVTRAIFLRAVAMDRANRCGQTAPSTREIGFRTALMAEAFCHCWDMTG